MYYESWNAIESVLKCNQDLETQHIYIYIYINIYIYIYVRFQDLGCTLGQILLHFMIYNTQIMMSDVNMNFKPK